MSQTRWLNQQKFISYSFGGWLSRINMPAGLVSPKASLLDWQASIFLLDVHVACSLCTHIPGISSSSCKDTSLRVLCNFNCFFEGPISEYGHVLKNWRLGLQHMNFEGILFGSPHPSGLLHVRRLLVVESKEEICPSLAPNSYFYQIKSAILLIPSNTYHLCLIFC